MKQNQNAFTIIEVILCAVIVGMIGFTTWFVLANKQLDRKPKQTVNTTEQQTEETKQTDLSKLVQEFELDIKSEADLEKLPDIVPASFKEYAITTVNNLLKDCPGSYMNVFKVSAYNIRGGIVIGMDSQVHLCGSGAPHLFVRTPENTWESVSVQGGTPCTSENGGKVYEEFAEECYTGKDSATLIANPNGSIADAN